MTPLHSGSLDLADLHDAHPECASGTAVLLLAGSSGRIENERADLLAQHGARVRAIRWFGGVGQRPAPHEVPIELFIEQLELLRRDSDRVAIFGTSFGAEAALVTASVHPTDATIAVSPSSVVWSGVADGRWSSHWTHGGNPLPAMPFDSSWRADTDPPAYRSLYESSIEHHPELSVAATIRAEDIVGDLVLVAGGDDQVWPSVPFADRLARRRTAAGLDTVIVTHPAAGHRLLLPGETAVVGGQAMARGGSPDADAELGALAWPEITRALDLVRA
ncbi:acyl-CoA thioester hydrolase/BAAT C-terminal domain-containing protein [Microbacterium sp. K24]|uniref:acyl-CoA thioester hydrolase/BAAT C-terminal domain-containing protein n=1 Tax=Microbacterium sp. K24 TaxID=2305446 RepID=UPI00197B7C49|nr:acyl-CoA thioester hydrolase/BAAT C-terminal domain-containing protein [Microbacterium sp. K24]